MSVSVNDILDFLVAKSAAPSTMGAQLERLKYGVQLAPDPFRARNEVEDNLLAQAAIIRCVDEFAAREELDIHARPRAPSVVGYKALTKIQEHANPWRSKGKIALDVLRAYQERNKGSQECGLVAVYNYLEQVAPSALPPPPKNDADLLQHFRTGTAKRARNLACEVYADSLLALQYHVRVWNKKRK